MLTIARLKSQKIWQCREDVSTHMHRSTIQPCGTFVALSCMLRKGLTASDPDLCNQIVIRCCCCISLSTIQLFLGCFCIYLLPRQTTGLKRHFSSEMVIFHSVSLSGNTDCYKYWGVMLDISLKSLLPGKCQEILSTPLWREQVVSWFIWITKDIMRTVLVTYRNLLAWSSRVNVR